MHHLVMPLSPQSSGDRLLKTRLAKWYFSSFLISEKLSDWLWISPWIRLFATQFEVRYCVSIMKLMHQGPRKWSSWYLLYSSLLLSTLLWFCLVDCAHFFLPFIQQIRPEKHFHGSHPHVCFFKTTGGILLQSSLIYRGFRSHGQPCIPCIKILAHKQCSLWLTDRLMGRILASDTINLNFLVCRSSECWTVACGSDWLTHLSSPFPMLTLQWGAVSEKRNSAWMKSFELLVWTMSSLKTRDPS